MDWYSIWMTSNSGIHYDSRCAWEIELVYGIVAMIALNGRVHLWHDPFLLGFCTLEPSCCKGPVGEEDKIYFRTRVLLLEPSCCKGTMGENTKYPFLLGFCILEPSCCKGHLGEEHKIFWTSVHLCLQAYLALRNKGTMGENTKYPFLLGFCILEPSCCKGHLGERTQNILDICPLVSPGLPCLEELSGRRTERFSILIQDHYQFSFCRSKRNSVFRKGTLSSCKCYRCDFLKGKVVL